MSLGHCPFCDEDMPYLVPKKTLGTDGWRMFCGRCGAYGPWAETVDEAEKLWNAREVRCSFCKQICRGQSYVDDPEELNGDEEPRRWCQKCYSEWVDKRQAEFK